MKAKLHTKCALCGRPFDDDSARFERESGVCDGCALDLYHMRYRPEPRKAEAGRTFDPLTVLLSTLLWVGVVAVSYALYVVNTGG